MIIFIATFIAQEAKASARERRVFEIAINSRIWSTFIYLDTEIILQHLFISDTPTNLAAFNWDASELQRTYGSDEEILISINLFVCLLYFKSSDLNFLQSWNSQLVHGVWKSQKKSHSTLRAKRATFTFWVDKS